MTSACQTCGGTGFRYRRTSGERCPDPNCIEGQRVAWRALLSDRERLGQFVEVLAEHGLRMTEAGTVEVIQR